VLVDGDDANIRLLAREDVASAGITLELGVPAHRLDLTGSRVLLADGRALGYDDLVIATGARARDSPWGRPEHLHLLRTRADAARLRADLLRGGRLVVVGAGFVGSEVASSATRLGLAVSIVDPLPVPMSRVLGDEVGRMFRDLHPANGVTAHFGAGVEHVREDDGGLLVTLTDGRCLPADTVVVGIGVRLNDEWLADSGLPLDGGVISDEFCRAVGHANVYAVGDIARWHHPRHGELVRVEHWTNAVEQAACVAHNIVNPGAPRPYAPVEYVWSDQYDWKIQVAGRPPLDPTEHDARPVVLGDPGSRFAALWSDVDGQLRGAVTVNWPRVMVRARRALAAAEPLTSALADLRSATAAPR